jgi:hypothetical protein
VVGGGYKRPHNQDGNFPALHKRPDRLTRLLRSKRFVLPSSNTSKKGEVKGGNFAVINFAILGFREVPLCVFCPCGCGPLR